MRGRRQVDEVLRTGVRARHEGRADTPAKGQAFFGWVGACKSGANACTVTLSASLAVTATFAPPTLVSTRPIAKGLRLTVAYKTKESGTLKLSAVRSKVTVARSKRLSAPGKGLLPVTVKRHGKYTVTLTLTSKTGIQILHWVVTLKLEVVPDYGHDLEFGASSPLPPKQWH